MKIRFKVLLPVILITTIIAGAPVQISSATSQGKFMSMRVPLQASSCSDQPQPRQVDLCCMAVRLTSQQSHSQVSLSYGNKDQAGVFCSTGQFYSINSYAKTGNILPNSPDAPFSASDLQRLQQPSNTGRASGVPLQQAIGQNYKFSFTIYWNGPDQQGTPYDPHLIVTK